MRTGEIFGVRWRGVDVGHIDAIDADMWYLSGRWTRGAAPEGATFEDIAGQLDAKRVVAHPSAGTRVELIAAGGESTHALVLSLSEATLSLRRVLRPEAVQWLLKNVW